ALVKTDAGVVLGTSVYMSPEQARGLEVDARTDIWSLGVVLYEMLAGQAPFAGETTSDVIAAILEREPPPMMRYAKDAPEALEWIVTKALTKEKEERYQTAREMLTDLRRLEQRLKLAAELRRSSPPSTREGETADGRSANATPSDAGANASAAVEKEPAPTGAVQSARDTLQLSSLISQLGGSRRRAGLVLLAAVL